MKIIDIERRNRENGEWQADGNPSQIIGRLARSNNVSVEDVTAALERGEQLTTGFADYRLAEHWKTSPRTPAEIEESRRQQAILEKQLP